MKLQNLINSAERIEVMDIGAAVINEVPIYKKLLEENLAHLNAFEGDSRQVQKIKEEYGDKVTIFNDFLSDGTKQTLYVADELSGMTSLLKPNLMALKFFNGFQDFGKIERTEEIQTKKLDDITTIPEIDLLKMDIQGSELSVLQNGLKKIRNCLAIQLEVSYVCLYENQPTFGDIDKWMREHGFIPHCFLDVKRWSITPTIFNNNFRIPGNQLLESDIVYIKDPLNLDKLSDSQLKKLALISHYCFSSYDLTIHFLLKLISRGSLDQSVHSHYLGIINGMVL